ncbi:MAG TPA: trehalose-6-phosphate synthase [Vicinamibacteria bacterium]|nr:trehalose-6-phosphate synthase [Vicinamibacteria bacterium]
MRRNGPVIALLAGLVVLAWGASIVAERMSRRWFEEDVDQRSRLAVSGARETLSRHWRAGDRERLRSALTTLTRDEHILAAAACGTGPSFYIHTPEFPGALTCASVAPHVAASASAATGERWSEVRPLAGGRVHVSATELFDEGGALGFVILVHDLTYADLRGAAARRATFVVLSLLAVVAALATRLATRFAWQDWTAEMRRLLRGTGREREFQPVLRDIHDLVERSIAEAQGAGGVWGPDRLRHVVNRHLHGQDIVVVANREPYIHERQADGSVRVLHPASGLVTALEPVMRACSGVWVAHGSGSADRQVADARGRLRVPPGEHLYRLRRVWLTPDEEDGYYYGFANEGLWALCHLAHTRPAFEAADWEHYRRVNGRFADAVVQEVTSDDPVVLVQDYHFALLPRMLRDRLPRATIISFWHIPWPNAERFGICPWHDELLEGMLGSSILGFQTQQHCNHFFDAVDALLEARIDRERQAVVQGGRTTLVRPYPISIEWPSRWAATAPAAAECRSRVREELGLAPDTLLGLGVDRLDYTKGIEERLLAVERTLERFPSFRGRLTFVQVAAPSRTKIVRYQQLAASVEALAARINERFGRRDYRPIVLAHGHHEPPTVFRYYRAADVCYVSSLHDGMNLVAKEFVAAREDRRGVLVLSSFTGAARELAGALIVNPYDLEEASAALAAALSMPVEEQEARMDAMRLLLAEFNVYRWAGRMLVDAARVRQSGTLAQRAMAYRSRAAGA